MLMINTLKKAATRINGAMVTVHSVGRGVILKAMTLMMLMSAPGSVFAEITGASAESGMEKILNILSWVFMWVGILMLVAAVISAVTALRNEDGERAQKSFINATLAMAVAANKFILNIVFGALGVGVTIGSPW